VDTNGETEDACRPSTEGKRHLQPVLCEKGRKGGREGGREGGKEGWVAGDASAEFVAKREEKRRRE